MERSRSVRNRRHAVVPEEWFLNKDFQLDLYLRGLGFEMNPSFTYVDDHTRMVRHYYEDYVDGICSFCGAEEGSHMAYCVFSEEVV